MDRVYSVTQINYYIKDIFEQDRILSAVQVKGEVSNCKYHSSGHIYFTIKDSGGSLACVMFAGSRASGLKFTLESGQSVIVRGNISVYERDGKYQLYARSIERDGIGLLYEKFEKLKAELSERGYFAECYKKPIPRYPKTVGIVTASTGAAIQDIRNVAGRRNPYVQLILYPAKVQGEGAAQSVVRGIQRLDAYGVDVIIVGRGGGSIEDLWAFNEEIVAEAIFACNTPVISAVGHEVDFTIADFVADMRAPTPSAAAELAVPDIRERLDALNDRKKLLSGKMRTKLQAYKGQLDVQKQRLMRKSPAFTLRQRQQLLAELQDRLKNKMRFILSDRQSELKILAERLNGVSPLTKLQSGYSYVESSDGKNIRSVDEVTEGDIVAVTVTDGTFNAKVTEVSKQYAKEGE